MQTDTQTHTHMSIICYFSFHISGYQKSKIKVPSKLVCHEGPFLAFRWQPYCCAHRSPSPYEYEGEVYWYILLLFKSYQSCYKSPTILTLTKLYHLLKHFIANYSHLELNDHHAFMYLGGRPNSVHSRQITYRNVIHRDRQTDIQVIFICWLIQMSSYKSCSLFECFFANSSVWYD